MTAEETIKGIECCSTRYGTYCVKCPYSPIVDCQNELSRDVQNLAIRQTAEINELKTELSAMRGTANSLKMHIEKLEKQNKRYENRIAEEIILPSIFGKKRGANNEK